MHEGAESISSNKDRVITKNDSLNSFNSKAQKAVLDSERANKMEMAVNSGVVDMIKVNQQMDYTMLRTPKES